MSANDTEEIDWDESIENDDFTTSIDFVENEHVDMRTAPVPKRGLPTSDM